MSVSKEEYLKRYTQGTAQSNNNNNTSASGSSTEKKRKKRKVPSSRNGVTIVDDTVHAQPAYVEKEEDEDEDLPTIVGQVEEKRPQSFSEDGSGGWTVVEGNDTNTTSGTVEDLSPARKRHDSDDDLSPQRSRTAADMDLSPPRKRHDSDDDLSPKRATSRSSDLSPKRKTSARDDGDLSPPRPNKKDDLSPPRSTRQTLSTGGKAGLLTSKEISEEVKSRKKKQDARLNADPGKLGKGAETVYRDKRGKKLSINEIIRQQEGSFTEEEEQGMEWGKGLVQKQAKVDSKAREEEEKDKPFARSADDPELDAMYKEKDRWGDPMPMKQSSDKKEKKSKKEKKEKKEFKPERRWKGSAPPNRYNIVPGYRWDGVDRSNGFEVKLLQHESVQKARDEEAYAWSVEDM